MERIEYLHERNAIKANTFDFTKNRKNTILPIIIVFCIPVLLYLQTLKFGFIYFDDDKLILNNIEFLSHFKNAPQAFQTDAFILRTSYFYRPLQTISYMTDIILSGGNNTWMFHLSNILLLGFIACLLYLLLRRFLIPSKLALLSTLVYCVHPLFVSSIAWIPARGDLLLSFFSLLSFLFFIEYLQKKKIKYLFLHWTTFTIALFCKETAVVLPFIFIIYYFAFSSEKRFEKKYLFNIVLYVISGICWFWLRSKAIEDFSNRGDVVGVFGQNDMVGLMPILSNLRTLPESLAMFFVPVDIAPIPGFSLSRTLTGSGIIIILIILFFNNKERSKKEKVFCFSWFLLMLLPTMLFKHELIDYLDHRFFLPLIGLLLFVLFNLPEKWFEKGDIKRSWTMIAVLVFLSCFTYINSRSYADPMTFYNSAITKNSNSVIAYNNRGAAYHQQGLFDKAINDYTKAIELKPDYANAYNSRGNAFFIQKSYDKAIADYTKVIALKLADANTYNNRGAAYHYQGFFDKACIDFKKAEELGSEAAKTNISKFCH
jgi:tetratricopeptide (TPR) repeat protein